jgi:hypothetical protein
LKFLTALVVFFTLAPIQPVLVNTFVCVVACKG